MTLIKKTTHDSIVELALNDPDRRNALGTEMFDALEAAISGVDQHCKVVLLTGVGSVFCAGFDMKACVDQPQIIESYILRLSAVIKSIRRLPQPVVAAAQGGAIAGGCALLTACDFIVGSQEGKYGYPVHALGISPAVTLPTLFQKLGEGNARALVMSGQILNGNESLNIGLLTHLATNDSQVHEQASKLATMLSEKPPHALQVTKQWLNELDGSLDDDYFDCVATASSKAISDDTVLRLKKLWS